jgi:RNA polymerase sigma-70 factor (ECF subfamily)
MLKLVFSSRRQTDPRETPWAEATDRDLLVALRVDDESAFNELINRKTKPLLQLCERILADAEEARDVVQVTLFKVWENRCKYNERWSPNTWIYRIASNLAIDHLRARRSREKSQEPIRHHLLHLASGRREHRVTQVPPGEIAAVFENLAAGLPDKQRLTFLLREVEGLSSQEVADILVCRESTVRNHLFNARRFLRTEMVKRYPEYAADFSCAAKEQADELP